MKDLVIVGASGFAKEILWQIQRINDIEKKYNFLGFIDIDTGKNGVIGDDEYIINYQRELCVVIAIADPVIRKNLAEKYKKNSYISFPNIIDPSVLMSDSISMGCGNIICGKSLLTVDIKMGDFNIINFDCKIMHEVEIGSFVSIYPSVNVSGNVCIEDGVSIGTGTQILQGRSLGRGAVIGAGAVVISDIPNDVTAVGVPAKVVKDRR